MPIDIIRNASAGTPGGRASHMVRAGTEMVMKEGRNPDGERITVYTAMGICGTEATGLIVPTELVKDVTCARCKGRATRELAPEPLVHGSHGWDDAPVLSSPEAVEAPEPPKPVTGRQRHGAIVHARAERRHQMKAGLRK